MIEYIFYAKDNFQFMGFEKARDEKTAIKQLIDNNSSISEFDLTKVANKIVVDNEYISNVKILVDYLWKDEERNYKENTCNNHIFKILKKLKSYL